MAGSTPLLVGTRRSLPHLPVGPHSHGRSPASGYQEITPSPSRRSPVRVRCSRPMSHLPQWHTTHCRERVRRGGSGSGRNHAPTRLKTPHPVQWPSTPGDDNHPVLSDPLCVWGSKNTEMTSNEENIHTFDLYFRMAKILASIPGLVFLLSCMAAWDWGYKD